MNVELAHDVLARFLKTDGKRRATPERFAVLDEIMKIPGHFDAEHLYFRLITNGVKVSRATVYNTLDILQECGLVSKYRFGEGSSRYEHTLGRPHHHHMVCLECGEIIEFVSERLEHIQREACEENGFSPQSSTVQVFGTCAGCRKKG